MKKNGTGGFVMAEVLMTVMLLMIMGTLLFSTASRSYARAERNAAKTQARLAAETAVQVFAKKIMREEPSEIINEKPEAIEMTVSSFWNADGSGLVLHAECSVGDQEESASMILKRERLSVYTPSNAGRGEETEDEP